MCPGSCHVVIIVIEVYSQNIYMRNRFSFAEMSVWIYPYDLAYNHPLNFWGANLYDQCRHSGIHRAISWITPPPPSLYCRLIKAAIYSPLGLHCLFYKWGLWDEMEILVLYMSCSRFWEGVWNYMLQKTRTLDLRYGKSKARKGHPVTCNVHLNRFNSCICHMSLPCHFSTGILNRAMAEAVSSLVSLMRNIAWVQHWLNCCSSPASKTFFYYVQRKCF